MRNSAAGLFAAVLIAILLMCVFFGKKHPLGETFWTRYGGAANPQVRRTSAAGRGVPDKPWAEAYWPPNFCRTVPPPVPGEPARPAF